MNGVQGHRTGEGTMGEIRPGSTSSEESCESVRRWHFTCFNVDNNDSLHIWENWGELGTQHVTQDNTRAQTRRRVSKKELLWG